MLIRYRQIIIFLLGVLVGGILNNNQQYVKIYFNIFKIYVTELIIEYGVISEFKPDFRWVMVDVNKGIQGDAHLIQIKNYGTILIDTGHIKQTNKVLIPFFKKKSN